MRHTIDYYLMKTKYSYTITTHMTSSAAHTFRTKKAEVVLKPTTEGSKSTELSSVEVTLPGKHLYENFGTARIELVKVLLRKTARQARIADNPGFLPDSWEEINEEGDPPNTKHRSAINVPSSGLIVVPYSPNHNHGLRINTSSDSPAIIQYYQAMGETNPVSRFSEMFKIIEYFSGKKIGSGEKTIRTGLANDKWRIPPDMGPIFDQIILRHGGDPADPAGYLWKLRSSCSHMRPDYGLVPLDEGRMGELYEGMLLLEAIVKYTLETHADTRES